MQRHWLSVAPFFAHHKWPIVAVIPSLSSLSANSCCRLDSRTCVSVQGSYKHLDGEEAGAPRFDLFSSWQLVKRCKAGLLTHEGSCLHLISALCRSLLLWHSLCLQSDTKMNRALQKCFQHAPSIAHILKTAQTLRSRNHDIAQTPGALLRTLKENLHRPNEP